MEPTQSTPSPDGRTTEIGRGRFIRDTSATDVAVDPAPRLRKRRRVLLASIAAAALLLIGATLAARSWIATGHVISRAQLRIAEVTRGPFIRDVAAEGTVVTANSPTLYAVSTGTVTFLVRAGDAVQKAQVLATLDSPTLVNQYDQERATLDSQNVALGRQEIELKREELSDREQADLARVQITAAEREFKREQTAYQEGVVPQRDFAKAGDDLASARLTYSQAVANAKLAAESLEYDLKTKRLDRDRQKLLVDNLARQVRDLTVRSPVRGIVGSLAVDQKATVAENAALLTVVDLSSLEIEFRVPESYATDLALDLPAEITYGGGTYQGTVTAVSPEVEDSEVRGRVRFAHAPPQGLRQNERVSVRIILDQRRDVLQVERGSFVDAGSVAYVVDGDEARRTPVKFGAMSVSAVEILSGLTPGERIVVSSVSDFDDLPHVRLAD
ncbi:MAG TPA: efflux RND transporter periplasmic adaptor subunit [Steroidobacteraceae bacterium]|nr:efflux RND transporter periplasmic adaptor subunit [Steroidobacteraceae bacterium]